MAKRQDTWVTDQAIIDAMLTPPTIPVIRDDFTREIYDLGVPTDIECRFYWTPGPTTAPVHPGVAPILLPEPQQPKEPRLPEPNPRDAVAMAAKLAEKQEWQLYFNTDTTWRQVTRPTYRDALRLYERAIRKFEAGKALLDETLSDGEWELVGKVEDMKPDMILTHGRGSNLDVPALSAFQIGWARTQSSLCFASGKDTENHRGTTFTTLQNRYPTQTFCGRSMGAHAAARGALWNDGITKVIFFTYSLVRETVLLDEELLSLPEGMECLFVVGNDDPRCPERVFASVRKKMRAKTWWIRVMRGDHGLEMQQLGKRVKICEIIGQLAAEWNRNRKCRDPEKTELTVSWEGQSDFVGQPVWTDWKAIVDVG